MAVRNFPHSLLNRLRLVFLRVRTPSAGVLHLLLPRPTNQPGSGVLVGAFVRLQPLLLRLVGHEPAHPVECAFGRAGVGVLGQPNRPVPPAGQRQSVCVPILNLKLMKPGSMLHASTPASLEGVP